MRTAVIAAEASAIESRPAARHRPSAPSSPRDQSSSPAGKPVERSALETPVKLLAIWHWLLDGAPHALWCPADLLLSCVYRRSCFPRKTAAQACPARALLLTFDPAMPSTVDQADLSGEAAQERCTVSIASTAPSPAARDDPTCWLHALLGAACMLCRPRFALVIAALSAGCAGDCGGNGAISSPQLGGPIWRAPANSGRGSRARRLGPCGRRHAGMVGRRRLARRGAAPARDRHLQGPRQAATHLCVGAGRQT